MSTKLRCALDNLCMYDVHAFDIIYIEANQQITNSEGWIIKSGQQQAVMVAPWVVEEEEKVLHLCLVGFLKSSLGGKSNLG